MLLQLVLFAVVAFAALKYLTQKKYKLPPGPRGLPVVGNILEISGFVDKIFYNWQQKYGEVFCCHFGSIPVIVLGSAKLVKEVFNTPVFNGRSGKMMICYLSKGKHGIVASEGQEWVEQRRFSLRHLRDFGFGKNYMESMIMDEVNEIIAWMKDQSSQPVNMHHRFERSVLNSLWSITTGRRFQASDEKFMKMLKSIDDTFVKPTITGILNLMAPALLKIAPELLGYNNLHRVANEFHEMLQEIIDEHKRTLPPEDQPRDFIDAYLHEINRTHAIDSSFYKETGTESLVAVIGDFFFAGSETTSVTLAWAMLYLAKHQEVQKKLQAELDNVVGKSRHVSLTDRSNLPYAEATSLEIFRKSSIVVTGVMHTALADSQIKGYDVPKDAWIMSNIYAIHHEPTIWGDPQNFRPERFLSTDGIRVTKSEHLLPFSIGKRQCIGESLARDSVFLFLTNIFQRFTIQLDDTKPEPTLDSQEGFILKPQDHRLIIKERLP